MISSYLQTVVANDADEGNHSVQNSEEGQRGLHISSAFFQVEINWDIFFLLVSSFIHSRSFSFLSIIFKQAWSSKQPTALWESRSLKFLPFRGSFRHLQKKNKECRASPWSTSQQQDFPMTKTCRSKAKKNSLLCRIGEWSSGQMQETEPENAGCRSFWIDSSTVKK